MDTRIALVTGASGYIGSQLVPALLNDGWTVRVLARTPHKLNPQWQDRVEVCVGDATNPDDVARALTEVHVAYYLLHSMDGTGDYRARDRELAHTFADAAAAAQVRRIVYLSGLHPEGELSDHLASRVEVGDILLNSGVPTAVLQAGVVLGAGSASFDMLRHLTERLPVAVGPQWMRNQITPIAVDDVIHYLLRAADLDPTVNRAIDIGMDETLTYLEMMRRYASVTGLTPRLIGTVPVLTPGLASHWVGLITPVSSGIAKPLVGSLIHDAVKKSNDAQHLLGDPTNGPARYDEAIRRAVTDIEPRRWGATFTAVGLAVGACAVAGSLLTEPRSRWYTHLRTPAWQPPPAAFPVVWTGLYGLVAVAATSTLAEHHERQEPARARSFARSLGWNLALNAAWSGVFFRGKNLPAATLTAAALTASGADLTRRAAATGPGKALALGVYTAWCAFATALTAELARRNS